MSEAAAKAVEAARLPFKRRKVIYKRDYNRLIDEVNRVYRLTCNLENVEQLDNARLAMIKTKADFDEVCLGFLDTIDETNPEDRELQEEWLKERDGYILNLDRAIGHCIAFRKRFEGNVRKESLNVSAANVSHSASGPARLPQVEVPKFNGNLRTFLDFKALYENLVHNDDEIAPVLKMHYLKKSLVGEAEKTLANLPVSEEGYKEAWSRVLSKYDNKRIIMHTHFNDLFNADKIRNESGLRGLLDQIDVALRGLRTCGEATDRWSAILAYILYTHLDVKTRADFDNTVTTNAVYYSFRDLWKFCELRANNVEARKIEEGVASTASAPRPIEQRRSAFLTARGACVVCQGAHLLIDCVTFCSKTPSERLKLIQANRLCVNCFSKTHGAPSCPSIKSCRICQSKHHYLLHLGEIPGSGAASPATNAVVQNASVRTEERTSESGSTSSLATSRPKMKNTVVLPSAKVRFTSGRVSGEARILIDNCSQPTLISDTLVPKFRLRTYINPTNKPIRGIGFQTVGAMRSCRLKLASRISEFVIEVEADVIPADAIPYSINTLSWKEDDFNAVSKFKLADTAFYNRNPRIDRVDLILGAQYVEKCMINESSNLGTMVLRNTTFGWTINGEFPTAKENEQKLATVCCGTTTSIEQQVAEFLESGMSETSNESAEFCEKHFVSNTTRAVDGKFVVRLPFALDPSLLGSNRRKAAAMLNYGQMSANAELKQGYQQFLEEYEHLGHMSVNIKGPPPEYVIPHHAVIRPESSTTRTRVVFNASAPSSSGYSLNDLLAVGPQIQPELFDTLIGFRRHQIVFTADIAKMYRCVWVHPDDRKFQQILWRPAPNEPIKTYALNTVTYGTAPASFLAVRCLSELAKELTSSHPRAASAIRNNFYMDDLMTGAESSSTAIDMQKIIHQKLQEAGFVLRKYQTNSPKLADQIPRELKLESEAEAIGKKWKSMVLGIHWNSCDDTLGVKCCRSEIIKLNAISKRQMLSEISKVFDPLGLISPFTVNAKFLLKEAWSEPIGWDDYVSNELAVKVKKYLAELQELTEFEIRRPYKTVESEKVEIVGFCDASASAYAAVVYVRSQDTNGKITITLACAKTRIAPSKTITVPKLELQGALLLSELSERVRKILELQPESVTLYSDSQVVLAWLSKPLSKWTVYVRNRIAKILECCPKRQWKYVSTKENPADVATRGMTAKELLQCKAWTEGPEFLRFRSDPMPERKFETNLEMEKPKRFAGVTTKGNGANRSFVDRGNSYRQLLVVFDRVLAFVKRWKAARSSQVKYICPNIRNSRRAKVAMICLLQADYFTAEIADLRSNHRVSSKSSLKTLNPFLDEDGLIRVKGRLEHSQWSYNRKHPIVVPGKSRFLRLYVEYVHETFCHAGKSFILSFVMSEFWVCGGLHSCVKAVIYNCVTCARYRAETFGQVMGQLPSVRVNPSRPFTNTGLDFCGPFNCKCLGHRSTRFNKIYACLFVCMATRAIHIEIVSSLSSTHFLMSLHRFVARRGLPSSLYSDCGTNFVGAHNYLKLDDTRIRNDELTHPIKWIFNPPRSPHRGGIWEAAVKSAKSHITRVIGNQSLNFEEFVTLFSRVEAILNSRPLCYRSAPRGGELILTPAHFLMGSTPFSVDEPEECRLPLWKRYELIRIMVQSFWKVWRLDYLNSLQLKMKWQYPVKNVERGQIVLLKIDSAPCQWPTAIVEEVYPDEEGYVRTVTVRTSSGAHLKRDVRYLVKLPLEALEVEPHQGGTVNTGSATSEPGGNV